MNPFKNTLSLFIVLPQQYCFPNTSLFPPASGETTSAIPMKTMYALQPPAVISKANVLVF
jgi:hypothetical protein